MNDRRPLRAGPWSLVHEAGDLRDLRVDGVLVISRIYAAVRDGGWRTIGGAMRDLDLAVSAGGFRISYLREHRAEGIAFDSRVELTGTADGRIVVAMRGVAGTAFSRNRIGLCVLHDQGLAGAWVRIGHPDGNVEETQFPDRIVPHLPFRDVAAITVRPRPGREATVRFHGEVFETEDQRNWGDASFKSYSTPAHLPRPVTVAVGDVVEQRVELRLSGPGMALAVELDGEPTPARLAGLRALGIDRLRSGRPISDFPIDLVLRGEPASWPDPAGLQKQKQKQLQLASVVALPSGASTTPTAWVEQLRARFPGVPVGGGNAVQFTELNRDRPVDAAWDVLSVPLDPCVHADDVTTLLDNVPAIGAVACSAQALVRGVALHLVLAHGRHPALAERHRGEIGATWLTRVIATAAAAGVAVLSLGPASYLVDDAGRPTVAGRALLPS